MNEQKWVIIRKMISELLASGDKDKAKALIALKNDCIFERHYK